LIARENRPKAMRVTKVIQGHETNSFKSKFGSWPSGTNALTSTGEEGRGIVAGTVYFIAATTDTVLAKNFDHYTV
jgi:hypothetical protein